MAKPESKGKGGGGSSATTPPDGAILGTEGADLISPTAGIELSTAGDDIIWALGGDDTVDAGGGNDTVEGGDGNDQITGGAGDDTLNGGAGDDIFIEGAGSDTIDGGDGYDTVIYDGLESDYSIEYITTTRGKREIITGFIVTDLSTGDVDTLNSVDQLVFAGVPSGEIITQGDFAFTPFDGSATVDPLANDYLEGGNIGEGLTLTAILDVQIDLDLDGVNDLDLIPDGATLADFQAGVMLNDGAVAGTGSILTLNPDGTLTWDPNGVYDTEPASGGTAPVIQFWYEVEDAGGATQYGDVTFQVVYPAPPGDVTFENMTLWDPIFVSYIDGPDGKYFVSQMNEFGGFEYRDEGATTYDYDGDGDDEFRIWTEGTSEHYINLRHRDVQEFTVTSAKITGLDAGEAATFWFVDGSGAVIGTAVVDETDLDGNDVVTFANPQPIGQLVVFSDGTGEFFIDDITFA